MTVRRPSKIWRLVVSSPEGPIKKPQSSEAAARDAVEKEKQTTTGNRILVQKWQDGQWDQWLRWVRTGNSWHAE